MIHLCFKPLSLWYCVGTNLGNEYSLLGAFKRKENLEVTPCIPKISFEGVWSHWTRTSGKEVPWVVQKDLSSGTIG